MEDFLEAFTAARPRLFGIAYRMLGSATEAEDLVQEAWVRWQTCDRAAVTNPPAFLATTVTRLAINALQSARARRETYIGPWLPEPVDTAADPFLGAERGEALRVAVLMLLEKLTPAERAAYVLREAFDYPYDEIAEILKSNAAAVRQHVSRARKHLAASRPAPLVAPDAERELLTRFVAAARNGDLDALERLFAADVASVSDGNGARRISRVPVVGAVRVARYLASFSTWFWDDVDIAFTEANGQPSAVLRRGDGTVLGLLTLDGSAAGIDRILWLMNPAKLTYLSSHSL